MGYSWAWRKRRKEDLKRVGYRCQRCHVPGMVGGCRNLERSHLDGDNTHDEPGNTAVLCIACHRRHDYARWAAQCRETRGRRKDAARPLITGEEARL